MQSLVVVFLCLSLGTSSIGQLLNRAPHFIPGTGDMSKFSLSENTPVGTPVYQLKGIDPENSVVHYSISGQQFIVDRHNGVVTLVQKLDREQQDVVEVIISLTDESIAGTEPNTVSLRREITVLDENDNSPEFHNRPYSAVISESAPIGAYLNVSNDILVTDKDGGPNSDVTVDCYIESHMRRLDDVCETFNVYTDMISVGRYRAYVTLTRALDYESRSAYVLTLKASDKGQKVLSAFASVAIDVVDVQDQPPIFLNAPFSATVAENTPQGTSIMTIKAKDGDSGSPRNVKLTLEDDYLEYFELMPTGNEGEAVLQTSSNLIDRENVEVLQNGGIYTFYVKATEYINNEIPAEYSISQVTIVVTDIDDQLPTFNADHFDIYVPEDVAKDTSLPGLSMTITDHDLGPNSRYNLSLIDVKNSHGIFAVSPSFGEGRTPIVIRVLDNSMLDYDSGDETMRLLIFDVVASVRHRDVAKTRVTVHVVDANDNSPIFGQTGYKFHVAEDAGIGHQVGTVEASDKDSGLLGHIKYTLRGFGADKFATDPAKGGVKVAQKLDHENQKSYSLTMEARDGGGKVATANVLVEVDDVNDNSPQFESREYHRIIRDGATSFEPQLFVRATDVDGPTQGAGKISYSIASTNSISDAEDNPVFAINAKSGEITIERPVSPMDTPTGQYELIIKATDFGIPPLSNETRVVIRVGIPGNQRPIFKGNFNKVQNMLSGPASYKALVDENASPGTVVATVMANDPDGVDSHITYHIAGGDKDNFIIEPKSGIITVSPDARLDLDSGFSHYNVAIHAVDAGIPVPETATTTLFVTIKDINNKPPVFLLQNSTAYISERANLNETVLQVRAFDADTDAELVYSLVEPISAADKTGQTLKPTNPYDYKKAFRINSTNGEIYVNSALDYKKASVFTLTVMAKDEKAVVDAERQVAKAEVIIFVQAYSDDNPVFLNDGWSATNPNITVTIEEEKPIGTKILNIQAKDPLDGRPIGKFKVLHSDTDVFTMVPNGEVILTKRLDYDTLLSKVLSLTVEAATADRRRSTATVSVRVINLNDNAPTFKKSVYKTSLLENAKYPTKVFDIEAIDLDPATTKEEIDTGFGVVRYSLTGENSQLFTIDPMTGLMQIAPNATLDREKQSVLRFSVVATDTPKGGPLARKTSSDIIIDVIDVNDNVPTFEKNSFTAVVPENAPPMTHVVNMTAFDPDEGIGGQISYEIADEGDANGLFHINQNTGEIKSDVALTGKGRSEPYYLTIRAQDGGGFFSDATLSLYIGDISANDGVPIFIKPTLDQIAYISENATIGSPVFQAIASDPDDPGLPSGKLTYKLLNDGTDYLSFRIDPDTGLITTRKMLDREKQDRYTLVLVVADRGEPPQHTSRIMVVNVTDVDDHKPHFQRGLDDVPVVYTINEEVPNGTFVGEIAAVDEDINENGAIDYLIIYGNELSLFNIKRTQDNKGVITTNGRLDREDTSQHILTVKCFKANTRAFQLTRKPYNRLDPSEIQLAIRLLDIDDNTPRFPQTNITIGVRLTVPIDTALVTVEAVDDDSNAMAIEYSIRNSTFVPLIDFGGNENATNVFRINRATGELRTARGLSDFVDGFFKLDILANNSHIKGHHSNKTIQVYVVRDRDLLKFVFNKPPAEVRRMLPEFESEIKEALKRPEIEVHVYDTQFHAKQDNSLDFSSTSSCFQLVGKEALSTKEMLGILEETSLQDRLAVIYGKYHVASVEQCAFRNLTRADTTPTQLWVLIIACLIGISALIASFSVCYMHRKYKKHSRKALMREVTPPMPPLSYISSSHTRVYAEPLYST